MIKRLCPSLNLCLNLINHRHSPSSFGSEFDPLNGDVLVENFLKTGRTGYGTNSSSCRSAADLLFGLKIPPDTQFFIQNFFQKSQEKTAKEEIVNCT